MEIQLADILTLAGAAIAAPLITGFVELLKRTLPIGGYEQAVALVSSLGLVIAASVDRHLVAGATTLNDAFVSFVAWLAIAKLATGVYDEITAAPGSFRGE
jgi:hypothetical protein